MARKARKNAKCRIKDLSLALPKGPQTAVPDEHEPLVQLEATGSALPCCSTAHEIHFEMDMEVDWDDLIDLPSNKCVTYGPVEVAGHYWEVKLFPNGSSLHNVDIIHAFTEVTEEEQAAAAAEAAAEAKRAAAAAAAAAEAELEEGEIPAEGSKKRKAKKMRIRKKKKPPPPEEPAEPKPFDVKEYLAEWAKRAAKKKAGKRTLLLQKQRQQQRLQQRQKMWQHRRQWIFHEQQKKKKEAEELQKLGKEIYKLQQQLHLPHTVNKKAINEFIATQQRMQRKADTKKVKAAARKAKEAARKAANPVHPSQREKPLKRGHKFLNQYISISVVCTGSSEQPEGVQTSELDRRKFVRASHKLYVMDVSQPEQPEEGVDNPVNPWIEIKPPAKPQKKSKTGRGRRDPLAAPDDPVWTRLRRMDVEPGSKFNAWSVRRALSHEDIEHAEGAGKQLLDDHRIMVLRWEMDILVSKQGTPEIVEELNPVPEGPHEDFMTMLQQPGDQLFQPDIVLRVVHTDYQGEQQESCIGVHLFMVEGRTLFFESALAFKAQQHAGEQGLPELMVDSRPEVVEGVLCWLYTGDLPAAWHDPMSGDGCYLLAEALELASLWHIPVLVQELVRAVCEEVDAETAPYLLVTCAKLGHKQEVERLVSLVLAFMARGLEHCMGSQHWQDMVDVLTQDGHGTILIDLDNTLRFHNAHKGPAYTLLRQAMAAAWGDAERARQQEQQDLEQEQLQQQQQRASQQQGHEQGDWEFLDDADHEPGEIVEPPVMPGHNDDGEAGQEGPVFMDEGPDGWELEPGEVIEPPLVPAQQQQEEAEEGQAPQQLQQQDDPDDEDTRLLATLLEPEEPRAAEGQQPMQQDLSENEDDEDALLLRGLLDDADAP